ncbi:hypothetical protein [Lysobacter humi (ex Lee et al. 2017)]
MADDDRVPKGWWSRPPTEGDKPLLLAVLAVLIAGLYALDWYFKYDVMARCVPAVGGMRCAVSHTSDSAQDLTLCVEVKRLCANGNPSLARGCFSGVVAPKRAGSLLIGDREFSNASDCVVTKEPHTARVFLPGAEKKAAPEKAKQ